MPKKSSPAKSSKKTATKKLSSKKQLNWPSLNKRTFTLGMAVLLLFSMLGAFAGQAWQDSRLSAKAAGYNYSTVMQNWGGTSIKICKSGGRINIKIDSSNSGSPSQPLTSEFVNSATGGIRFSTINSTINSGVHYKYRTVQGIYFSISSDAIGGNYAKNPDDRPRIAVSRINGC